MNMGFALINKVGVNYSFKHKLHFHDNGMNINRK